MQVAFDIDNVICATLEGARSILASDLAVDPSLLIMTGVYGAPIGSEVPSIAERIRIDHSFWDRLDLLSCCPALAQSIEALWRLHNRGILKAYVTRRPPSVRQVTMDWLSSKNAPPVPAYFVGNTHAQKAYTRCKAEVCLEIGATHLVDDHAYEIEAAYQKGIIPIAVDATVGQEQRLNTLKRYPAIKQASSAAHAVDLLLGTC